MLLVLTLGLCACDELAGFITAISYVKPHRSVFEVDVPSVKKKMKDKAFARSVNRQEIIDGAQELGVPLDEHIDFCVKAMQARAEELGLKGSASAMALMTQTSRSPRPRDLAFIHSGSIARNRPAPLNRARLI